MCIRDSRCHSRTPRGSCTTRRAPCPRGTPASGSPRATALPITRRQSPNDQDTTALQPPPYPESLRRA
eukprot:15086735-Alexandrium_andersonii.AAC.1